MNINVKVKIYLSIKSLQIKNSEYYIEFLHAWSYLRDREGIECFLDERYFLLIRL